MRRQFERQKVAATVIQKHYRAHIHSQRERAHFLKMKTSVLLIQVFFHEQFQRKGSFKSNIAQFDLFHGECLLAYLKKKKKKDY